VRQQHLKAAATSAQSAKLAIMTGRLVEAVDSLMNKMEVGHDGNRSEGEQLQALGMVTAAHAVQIYLQDTAGYGKVLRCCGS
jgi:hypothetical protein